MEEIHCSHGTWFEISSFLHIHAHTTLHTPHSTHTSAAEHVTPDAPAAADMADPLESLCLLQPSQGTGRHHPTFPVPARVRASLIPKPHSTVQSQSQVLVLRHSRSCILSRLPNQISVVCLILQFLYINIAMSYMQASTSSPFTQSHYGSKPRVLSRVYTSQ